MEFVVEMLPKWREMQISFREMYTELFACACISSSLHLTWWCPRKGASCYICYKRVTQPRYTPGLLC